MIFFFRKQNSGFIILFLILFVSSCLHAQSYHEKFNSLIGTRDTIALEKILKEWEKDSSGNAELYTSWFNYYIVKGRKENNVSPSDSVLILKDSTGKAIYSVRGEYYYVETIAKGLKKLNEGIKKHPARLDMYFGKAWLFGDMGKANEQADVIVTVIEKSRKNKNKWLWTNNQPLADAKAFMLKNIQNYLVQMLEQQKVDAAQKACKSILSVYPSHVETLCNYSVSFFYKNDYDKAIEILNKAESIEPRDVVVLTNMAYAYRQKNDKAKAKIYFEKVLEYGDDADKDYARGQLEELKKEK